MQDNTTPYPSEAELQAFAADPTQWGDPEETLTGEAAAAAGRADLEAAGFVQAAPEHPFFGPAGIPDADECTYRSGTDATYCGRPSAEHHDATWWGDPRDHECGGTWGVCDDDEYGGSLMHRCALAIDHHGACWCGPCNTWADDYDDEDQPE